MARHLVRIFSLLLGSVFFTTNVVLANIAESNFWKERRSFKTTNKAAQLASLPSPSRPPAFSQTSILNQLPSVQMSLSPSLGFRKQASAEKRYRSRSLQSLIETIPYAHGSIRDVYEAKSENGFAVALIQDVHLNNEAQANIGALLQELINQGQIGLIGVEGAFAAVDFKRFRDYPHQELTREITKAFLDNNLLGAPSYVGITSVLEPPPFIGVDDKAHYDANVAAYLETRQLKPKTKDDLKKMRQALAQAKEKIFSSELKSFDGLREAYYSKAIGLGTYVQKLSAINFLPSLVIAQFLEAYQMESTLDFARVESERRMIVEKLTKALNEAELSGLVSQSLAYRLGRIGFGDYHQSLKDLCEQKGIRLRETPAFENYIRYVLLSDGIKAEPLFRAIQELENQIVQRLAVSSEEQDLVQQSEWLRLTEKLVEFSLTAEEWTQYKERRNISSPPLVGGRRGRGLITSSLKKSRNTNLYPLPTLSHKGRGILNLTPFESFYEQADLRSRKMVQNLLAQIPNSKSEIRNSKQIQNLKSQKPKINSFGFRASDFGFRAPKALIVGGFHTPLMTQLLKEKNISYVVVSPKITKVEEDAGTAYLSVFAQEKTPLDRLLAGEELFVNPTTAVISDSKTALRLTAALEANGARTGSQSSLVDLPIKDVYAAKTGQVGFGILDRILPGTKYSTVLLVRIPLIVTLETFLLHWLTPLLGMMGTALLMGSLHIAFRWREQSVQDHAKSFVSLTLLFRLFSELGDSSGIIHLLYDYLIFGLGLKGIKSPWTPMAAAVPVSGGILAAIRDSIEKFSLSIVDAFGPIFQGNARVIGFGESHNRPNLYRRIITALIRRYAMENRFTHLVIEAHRSTKTAYYKLLWEWTASGIRDFETFLEKKSSVIDYLKTMVPEQFQRAIPFSDAPFDRLTAVLGDQADSAAYFEMLRAAYESGMTIEPIDVNREVENLSEEEREEELTSAVGSILNIPTNRALIYFGAYHVAKEASSFGGALKNRWGDGYVAVKWLFDRSPGEQRIVEALKGRPMENKVFAVTDLGNPDNLLGSQPAWDQDEDPSQQKTFGGLFDVLVRTPFQGEEAFNVIEEPIPNNDFEKMVNNKNFPPLSQPAPSVSSILNPLFVPINAPLRDFLKRHLHPWLFWPVYISLVVFYFAFTTGILILLAPALSAIGIDLSTLPWYLNILLLGAPWWETKVFQEGGIGVLPQWLVSTGLSSDAALAMGWLVATIGFVFAHVLTEWIGRFIRPQPKPRTAGQISQSLLIPTVLFNIPFLFMSDISAAAELAIRIHAVWNLLKLTLVPLAVRLLKRLSPQVGRRVERFAEEWLGLGSIASVFRPLFDQTFIAAFVNLNKGKSVKGIQAFGQSEDNLAKLAGQNWDSYGDDYLMVLLKNEFPGFDPSTAARIDYRIVVDKAKYIQKRIQGLCEGHLKLREYEFQFDFSVYPHQKTIHLRGLSIGRLHQQKLEGQELDLAFFEKWASWLEANYGGWNIIAVTNSDKAVPRMQKYFQAQAIQLDQVGIDIPLELTDEAYRRIWKGMIGAHPEINAMRLLDLGPALRLTKEVEIEEIPNSSPEFDKYFRDLKELYSDTWWQYVISELVSPDKRHYLFLYKTNKGQYLHIVWQSPWRESAKTGKGDEYQIQTMAEVGYVLARAFIEAKAICPWTQINSQGIVISDASHYAFEAGDAFGIRASGEHEIRKLRDDIRSGDKNNVLKRAIFVTGCFVHEFVHAERADESTLFRLPTVEVVPQLLQFLTNPSKDAIFIDNPIRQAFDQIEKINQGKKVERSLGSLYNEAVEMMFVLLTNFLLTKFQNPEMSVVRELREGLAGKSYVDSLRLTRDLCMKIDPQELALIRHSAFQEFIPYSDDDLKRAYSMIKEKGFEHPLGQIATAEGGLASTLNPFFNAANGPVRNFLENHLPRPLFLLVYITLVAFYFIFTTGLPILIFTVLPWLGIAAPELSSLFKFFLLGAPWWETKVFQEGGISVLPQWLVSTGLSSDAALAMGWLVATVGFVFAHVLTEWIGRFIRPQPRRRTSRQVVQSLLIPTILFNIPFLFMSDISAAAELTIRIHTVWNFLKLTLVSWLSQKYPGFGRFAEKWLGLGSIVRVSPITSEHSKKYLRFVLDGAKFSDERALMTEFGTGVEERFMESDVFWQLVDAQDPAIQRKVKKHAASVVFDRLYFSLDFEQVDLYSQLVRLTTENFYDEIEQAVEALLSSKEPKADRPRLSIFKWLFNTRVNENIPYRWHYREERKDYLAFKDHKAGEAWKTLMRLSSRALREKLSLGSLKLIDGLDMSDLALGNRSRFFRGEPPNFYVNLPNKFKGIIDRRMAQARAEGTKPVVMIGVVGASFNQEPISIAVTFLRTIRQMALSLERDIEFRMFVFDKESPVLDRLTKNEIVYPKTMIEAAFPGEEVGQYFDWNGDGYVLNEILFRRMRFISIDLLDSATLKVPRQKGVLDLLAVHNVIQYLRPKKGDTQEEFKKKGAIAARFIDWLASEQGILSIFTSGGSLSPVSAAFNEMLEKRKNTDLSIFPDWENYSKGWGPKLESYAVGVAIAMAWYFTTDWFLDLPFISALISQNSFLIFVIAWIVLIGIVAVVNLVFVRPFHQAMDWLIYGVRLSLYKLGLRKNPPELPDRDWTVMHRGLWEINKNAIQRMFLSRLGILNLFVTIFILSFVPSLSLSGVALLLAFFMAEYTIFHGEEHLKWNRSAAPEALLSAGGAKTPETGDLQQVEYKILDAITDAAGGHLRGYLNISLELYEKAKRLAQSHPSFNKYLTRIDHELVQVNAYRRPMANPLDPEAYRDLEIFLTRLDWKIKNVKIIGNIIAKDIQVVVVSYTFDAQGHEIISDALFVLDIANPEQKSIAAAAFLDGKAGNYYSAGRTVTFEPRKGLGYMGRGVAALLLNGFIKKWVSYTSGRSPSATRMYDWLSEKEPRLNVDKTDPNRIVVTLMPDVEGVVPLSALLDGKDNTQGRRPKPGAKALGFVTKLYYKIMDRLHPERAVEQQAQALVDYAFDPSAENAARFLSSSDNRVFGLDATEGERTLSNPEKEEVFTRVVVRSVARRVKQGSVSFEETLAALQRLAKRGVPLSTLAAVVEAVINQVKLTGILKPQDPKEQEELRTFVLRIVANLLSGRRMEADDRLRLAKAARRRIKSQT